MLSSILHRPRGLLFVLCICAAPSVLAAQGRVSGAPGKACTLLTRPIVEQFAAATNKPVTPSGPSELPLGAQGTACDWGDVTFQVDPWPPAQLEKMRQASGREWEMIKGVGDAAYLHNVKDMMAEVFVRVGNRTFALLVTIPVGSTTAALKPTLVQMANTVVPKLR